MALIICGHQRSGTSLLQRLCDRHPDIVTTNEFGNFFDLDGPIGTYRRHILRRWWQAGNRSFFSAHRQWAEPGFDEVETGGRANPHALAVYKLLWLHLLQNLYLVTRYLFKMHRDQRECINVSAIEAALKGIFPGVRVVGDKHPDYVFVLDKLAEADGLSRVVIYRDPRDVASSTLEKMRTVWGKWWGKEVGTAEKIANRWVYGIELIERHADKLHVIRYEDLVADPQPVLTALANWLGVDHRGFRHQMIRASSVGKYHKGLSDQELHNIIRIAGPTMKRMGYEI